MSSSSDTADVDRNVATNLRESRERKRWSQGELARRMSDCGFGFTQTTIWKIEGGQRPVKIGEAAALADVLGLRVVTDLMREPEVTRHFTELDSARRAVFDTYQQLKQAAHDYEQAQIQLALTVRETRDAGYEIAEDSFHIGGWFDVPAERAVMEARIEAGYHDTFDEQINDNVDKVMQALREHGLEPPRPEDIQIEGIQGT